MWAPFAGVRRFVVRPGERNLLTFGRWRPADVPVPGAVLVPVGNVGACSARTPSWWGRDPTGSPPRSTLARAGRAVEVYEGAPTIGGGTRTEALTLEGFRHDVCSAVHPSLVASPFFRSLDLAALGVVLRQPEVAFAHPAGRRTGRCALPRRGRDGGAPGRRRCAYRHLVGPLVDWLDRIVPYVLGPMRSVPRDPLALARFALVGTPSVRHVTRRFATDAAPGAARPARRRIPWSR